MYLFMHTTKEKTCFFSTFSVNRDKLIIKMLYSRENRERVNEENMYGYQVW